VEEMTRQLSVTAGILNQRGFWLRCFLGRMLMVALVCTVICGVSYAQPDKDGPIRLMHVEGFVVNSHGNPVANVEVTLSRDDKVRMSTRTDASGAFHIDHAEGSYVFGVARTENAPAAHPIVVRAELATLVDRKKLYVVLGPGACEDACSSVYTSKQDFDHAIRKMSGR
jgi:hypothetical protein